MNEEYGDDPGRVESTATETATEGAKKIEKNSKKVAPQFLYEQFEGVRLTSRFSRRPKRGAARNPGSSRGAVAELCRMVKKAGVLR